MRILYTELNFKTLWQKNAQRIAFTESGNRWLKVSAHGKGAVCAARRKRGKVGLIPRGNSPKASKKGGSAAEVKWNSGSAPLHTMLCKGA